MCSNGCIGERAGRSWSQGQTGDADAAGVLCMRIPMIHAAPSSLVADLWPAIEKHVAAALDFHPFLGPADLHLILLNGGCQLFIVTGEGRKVQGFAIMEMVQYPSRRVANCLAAGGEDGFLGTAIHELLPVLKQWGAEHGADAFALTGRPGWFKALRDEGGHAEKLVTWWTRLGDVQGRRQQSDADHGRGTVERGTALPH